MLAVVNLCRRLAHILPNLVDVPLLKLAATLLFKCLPMLMVASNLAFAYSSHLLRVAPARRFRYPNTSRS